MKTLQQFINEYSQKQPWDYAENPFQIKYVPQKDIHSGIIAERSDISVHAPLLTFLATQCDSIVEFGTRLGESTIALLAGNPDLLISVDIERTPLLDQLEPQPNWNFIQDTSLNHSLDIGFPDLLVIDSDHSYEQVASELHLHASKVQKYIFFHDTVSCPGVNKAIEEYLRKNKQWSLSYDSRINHGAKIIQRTER